MGGDENYMTEVAIFKKCVVVVASLRLPYSVMVCLYSVPQ